MVIPLLERAAKATHFLKPSLSRRMNVSNKYVLAEVIHTPTPNVACSASSQKKMLRTMESTLSTYDVSVAPKVETLLGERATRIARFSGGLHIGIARYSSSTAWKLLVEKAAQSERLSGGLPISVGRYFSTTGGTKDNTNESAIAYVTSNVSHETVIHTKVDSVGNLLEDPPGYINLAKLFTIHDDMCFEYSNSSNNCFSNFATDIFRKILILAYEKGQDDGFHFKYDPAKILVKKESTTVIEVAIPLSQFKKGNSIYMDKVVGPVAGLAYFFCKSKTNGGYKEICDLMEKSLQKRFTLQEVLSHPFLWTPEEKFAAIMAARIFLSTGKATIVNWIKPAKSRTLKIYQNFQTAILKDFYNLGYDVKEENGEYRVSNSSMNKDWTKVFESVTFHNGYKNKKSFVAGDIVKMFIFTRDILAHLADDNMDAYAMTLKAATIKFAVIDLDREFPYHNLKEV